MEPISHFCALPQQLVLEAGLNRWTKRLVRWTITGALPNVSAEDQQECYALAFQFWSDECQLDFEYTTSGRTADLRMGSGFIDGRGGTLAWSELPNGADGPLDQMYDTGDRWTPALADFPSGLIPLLVTAAHEIGHAIGIGHSNDSNALMYPSLNVRTNGRPQLWDIREARARYGIRTSPPGPAPTPPREDDRVVVIPSRKVVAVYAPGWTLEERTT